MQVHPYTATGQWESPADTTIPTGGFTYNRCVSEYVCIMLHFRAPFASITKPPPLNTKKAMIKFT
jgi:hypothetical protein